MSTVHQFAIEFFAISPMRADAYRSKAMAILGVKDVHNPINHLGKHPLRVLHLL